MFWLTSKLTQREVQGQDLALRGIFSQDLTGVCLITVQEKNIPKEKCLARVSSIQRNSLTKIVRQELEWVGGSRPIL